MEGMGVQVEGYREFVRDLKRANYSFGKNIRQANRSVALKVAQSARAKARSQGGVADKTAPSIRPGASQASAYVALGGARYPFAMGAEFGGGKYGKGNPTPRGGYTTQFKAWRGNGPDAGYFLYPTIRSMSSDIEEAFLDAVDEAVKVALPN